ncbi:hypothetical protein [Paenibacillus sp. 2KB_22]|uniref:hypothetical protein n=1 Tax=Paenibacillus sp. 2KB_22 TaxID=3232978 RepID=UPI003F97E384
MAECEYFQPSCTGCTSKLYDGGTVVPSKRFKNLRTVTPTQSRQFCRKEPQNCVFHPRGLAFASKSNQQVAVRRAIEKDNKEMRGGNKESSVGIITYVILALIAFLIFKAIQAGY